ncbi:unnamed protein product, partial [Staurois parvus]
SPKTIRKHTTSLSAFRRVRPHADTSTFPWTRCVCGMTCRPCHLATSPGSLNSSASSPVIGRRNCSSGETHRRPITGEEEEPSSSSKIKGDLARERPEKEDS